MGKFGSVLYTSEMDHSFAFPKPKPKPKPKPTCAEESIKRKIIRAHRKEGFDIDFKRNYLQKSKREAIGLTRGMWEEYLFHCPQSSAWPSTRNSIWPSTTAPCGVGQSSRESAVKRKLN